MTDHIPVIQVDYFFVRTDGNTKLFTCLSAIDNTFKRAIGIAVSAKGRSDAYAVKALENFTKRLGFERVYLQTDPENSAMDVVRAVN